MIVKKLLVKLYGQDLSNYRNWEQVQFALDLFWTVWQMNSKVRNRTLVCRCPFYKVLLGNKKYKIMSTKSHIGRKTTAALAILFLLPPLIFFIMWSSIGLRYSGLSATEQMDVYLNDFPSWLRNIDTIHAISIVGCVIAIILAARSFKKHLLSVRVLMLLVVIVAIFIILFDIYQMV